MRKRDATLAASAALLALCLFSLSSANGAERAYGYCNVENVNTKTLTFSAIFALSRYLDQEGLLSWIVEEDVLGEFARRMAQPSQPASCGAHEGLERAVESAEWKTGYVRKDKYAIFYTDWVPPNAQLVRTLGPVTPLSAINQPSGPSESQGNTFGPRAREAVEGWKAKNGISDAGNFANTLALMIQTALVLQNFDPGPSDGLFGKKTLAAILAWQAAMGFAQTGDLAGVLAAILRTAMVLQGFDPGLPDAMFGTQAHNAIQAWQPDHARALAAATPGPAGGGGETTSDEHHMAQAIANDCIRVYEPPGVTPLTGFSSRMENNCNFKVHVTHGFNVHLDGTPIRKPWCTIGHGGSRGGALTLDPGESKAVAPIDHRVAYEVHWCACNDVYSWAAFARPRGPGVGDCLCDCAPN